MILTLLTLALVVFQDEAPAEYVSPYARWELGPPTDPDFFPIGVWLQDPRHAERYRRLGINTYVGLWKGPTEEQLSALSAAGMLVVCAQNGVAAKHLDDPTIIAWTSLAEPDNRQKNKIGSWGDHKTPAEVQRYYDRLHQRDPRRPVWLNLGQGVANDTFRGRGAKLEDYPGYAAACDILSFDIYPVANLGRDDGADFLWLIAKGLRRLRLWGGEDKVIWNNIECTSIHDPTLKATPAQVRAQVWISLIHGSRGIVWFVHQFQPELDPTALFKDGPMMKAVRDVNHEVLAYAPVLNGPADPRVRPEHDDRLVGHLAKIHEGRAYVFSVGMRNAPSKGVFRVDGARSGSVEVLGEDRSIELEDGVFEDDFGPYEVHVYRFDGPE